MPIPVADTIPVEARNLGELMDRSFTPHVNVTRHLGWRTKSVMADVLRGALIMTDAEVALAEAFFSLAPGTLSRRDFDADEIVLAYGQDELLRRLVGSFRRVDLVSAVTTKAIAADHPSWYDAHLAVATAHAKNGRSRYDYGIMADHLITEEVVSTWSRYIKSGELAVGDHVVARLARYFGGVDEELVRAADVRQIEAVTAVNRTIGYRDSAIERFMEHVERVNSYESKIASVMAQVKPKYLKFVEGDTRVHTVDVTVNVE